MYTKLRALAIIENNLKSILKYEKILSDQKKIRYFHAKEISSERRTEMIKSMLEYGKQSKKISSVKYSTPDLAKNVFEYNWMFRTASILYYSKNLSNLKKKNHWLKSIFFKCSSKKKVFWGSSNNKENIRLFCFLTDAIIVDNVEESDVVFYWLSSSDINSIIKCVDDANNINTSKKMVIFFNETLRKTNLFEILSKKPIQYIGHDFIKITEQF